MNGSLRKANSITPHDARASRLVRYMKVDYNAAAELYIPTARSGRRGRPIYRRFATAVEAIRFAKEVRLVPACRSETSFSIAKLSEATTFPDEVRLNL